MCLVGAADGHGRAALPAGRGEVSGVCVRELAYSMVRRAELLTSPYLHVTATRRDRRAPSSRTTGPSRTARRAGGPTRSPRLHAGAATGTGARGGRGAAPSRGRARIAGGGHSTAQSAADSIALCRRRPGRPRERTGLFHDRVPLLPRRRHLGRYGSQFTDICRGSRVSSLTY